MVFVVDGMVRFVEIYVGFVVGVGVGGVVVMGILFIVRDDELVD